MKGFFTRQETQSVSRPEGKTYSCISCGLYHTANTPRMKEYGNYKRNILIIGEAPGEVEDRNGKPWQGKTGHLLQNTLKSLGISLFDDCLSINAVICRPTEGEQNRTPNGNEIRCCRRRVLKAILDKSNT